MADIFISWGSPDKQVIQPLRARLRANGLDLFEYSEDMGAGDQINQRVNAEINVARMTIFCISDAALLSGWVQKEVNWVEKVRLDKPKSEWPVLVVVRVGAQSPEKVPDLFKREDAFQSNLSDPQTFEGDLAKFVEDVRERLGLAAPIIVPAALFAMTQQEFKDELIKADAQNGLAPLCRKVGMESFPQLGATLAKRYGSGSMDFSPFPGGRLVDQIDDTLKSANGTRKQNRRQPVWLWWCTLELFSPDAKVRKHARDRWFSRPSLLVMDSLSMWGDTLNKCQRLAAITNPANTALLWVPPYTGHTADLENIIEDALQQIDPLEHMFGRWRTVDAEPYVAFDIGTPTTLRRWLYSAFEDFKFEEPQPVDDNVSAMREKFPGNYSTPVFFTRKLGGSR